MTCFRVHAPGWTQPALVGADRGLEVVTSALPGKPRLYLRRGGLAADLGLLDVRPSARHTYLNCVVPQDTDDGLYDLELRSDGSGAVARRSVFLVPREAERLTLLHCSDLHLLKEGSDRILDRTPYARALLRRIRQVAPGLVICTGDLISRYGMGKRLLAADQIRWQIRWLAWHLAALGCPLCVTVGNHDVALAHTRRDWYAAMGGGWGSPTDDRSIDWGPYHLILMDCFAHYDPDGRQTASSFTEDQLAWLREDCAAARDSRLRLLFMHYDYCAQLPALLPELSVDHALYGHSVGLYPEVWAECGVGDGHLAAEEAYQLLHLDGSRVAVERVTWDKLLAMPG